MFHDRDNERDLCPFVGEVEAGLTVGWRNVSFTYAMVVSTHAFDHQTKQQDYGNIRRDYLLTFCGCGKSSGKSD